MAQAEVVAELNRVTGSPESRRLRREGLLPGVVYGKGAEAISISVNARDLRLAMSNRIAKGSLLTLVISGKKQVVQIQDVQRHPVRRELSHIDFLTTSASDIITASVNLEAELGVDLLNAVVEVSGKVSAIPQSLVVSTDLANDAGEIEAQALPLPKGMSLITEPSTVVARLTVED